MMNDFFEYISTWSVLKWIVLVLIAGFIGQFGRMAAEAIAAKIRAHRGEKEAFPEETQIPSISPPPTTSADNAAPDKKLLKALAKAKKKEAKKNN